ncbi:methyltransferase [Nocardioides panacisoli]|uniref:Methyltransferase small domain-containing protein n=1 Tax=Nocardioides panacisoli TaxID=627624 RepID=A0ABP7IXZ3_9ACTN
MASDQTTEIARFGDLDIAWDPRVLQPRAWTAAQSEWAAELSPQCPDGPILELFCGAGQIGLLAASLTGRPLVQADLDPVAAAYVRRNAAAAGLTTDVREAAVEQALAPDERFGLAVVDPPWVPTARIGTFPEDPPLAIDGGADGTDLVVLGVRVALRHLSPGGNAVVQVGDPGQVELIRSLLPEGGTGDAAPWAVLEVRDFMPRGMLVRVGPQP